MANDRDTEIDSCLAYLVLRDPDPWIGGPSTVYLDAFLVGAAFRHGFCESNLPVWRISGVLDDPAFYKPFVEATGHPTLSIRWAKALAMTHHSFAGGFAKLRDEAIKWHLANGVAEDFQSTDKLHRKAATKDSHAFWNNLAKRPAMFFGGSSGGMLYCFLNGMKKGGDWLELPPVPELDTIFRSISAQSKQSYGSPFAAFRVYDAQGLLKLVGLPNDSS